MSENEFDFSQFNRQGLCTTHDVILEQILLIFGNLSELEREIIGYRFGIEDSLVHDRDSVQTRYKISKSQLLEIERKAFKLIKESKSSKTLKIPVIDHEMSIRELVKVIRAFDSNDEKILRRKWGLLDGKTWETQELAIEFGKTELEIEELFQKTITATKKNMS